MLVAYFFILGLLFGSFANALIWRIKTGRSILKGRSICPNCNEQIKAIDLIPVLSWLLLRARCRYCKERISIQYPAVELLMGFVYALVFIHVGPNGTLGWLTLVFWLYIGFSLVVLAVYDLKWMLLPDKVLVPAITIAIAFLGVQLALGQPLSVVRGPLIAAMAAGGSFYALAAVSKGKWMGGGDIKLVFLMGLLLGIQKTLLAMFVATTAAALVGGLLLLFKKLHGRYIAFGPFLAAATFLVYIYGSEVIQLYLQASGINEL